MSGFQVGDAVRCVEIGPVVPEDFSKAWTPNLELGRAYRISSVAIDMHDGERMVALAGSPANTVTGFWAACRFRKIDKADDSFIALVRACKPSRAKTEAGA